MRYLITGTAGFVGFHVARRLLLDGHHVIGIDGFTPYYDVQLKARRHALLQTMPGFRAHRCMLEEFDALRRIALEFGPDRVIHLAAQAGVRYSLENPRAYIDANVIGSFNLLEICRELKPAHLMIASTSSVYGGNPSLPFSEQHRTDYPLTIYAATKKSMEVIAHNYAHLWSLPITAFRFFTVYGPWGRPDMALFKFVGNILKGEPIDVYNHGNMVRDFTYIDDLIEAIIRLCEVVPELAAAAPLSDADSLSPVAPFRIVNIGGGVPVKLLTFIEEIEAALGRPAIRNYMDMQPGDVPETEASTQLLEQLIGYRPRTPVRDGVREFVRWYLDYHQTPS